MSGLQQYVVSVATAAIICGIVIGLAPSGTFQGIIKMICGIFLTLMVIEPVTRVDVAQWISDFGMSYREDAESAAAFGEEIVRDTTEKYIKQECEAYILDKADALGAELKVEVLLSTDELPIPSSAVIRGKLSPSAQHQLEQIITRDLGISKENLQWIG